MGKYAANVDSLNMNMSNSMNYGIGQPLEVAHGLLNQRSEETVVGMGLGDAIPLVLPPCGNDPDQTTDGSIRYL